MVVTAFIMFDKFPLDKFPLTYHYK